MRSIRGKTAEAPRLAAPVSERDHRLGPAGASILLLEYGDYECPFCRSAHGLVRLLRDEFGSRLAFIYRHYPLPQLHPNALLAAQAAESAGLQGKFWEIHDLLFDNQESLGPASIIAMGRELDLDYEAFRAAIDDGRALARVREDRAGGMRSGVNGTPTFFVNGVRHKGLPKYEQFVALLQASSR